MNKYQKYPIGNKNTWEKSAENIVSSKTQIRQEDIPELLGWLQDMNWPGAVQISKYLKLIPPKQLVDPIIEIINGDDYIWSYWIITNVVKEWDKPSTAPLKFAMGKLLSNRVSLSEDYGEELEEIYRKNFK